MAEPSPTTTPLGTPGEGSKRRAMAQGGADRYGGRDDDDRDAIDPVVRASAEVMARRKIAPMRKRRAEPATNAFAAMKAPVAATAFAAPAAPAPASTTPASAAVPVANGISEAANLGEAGVAKTESEETSVTKPSDPSVVGPAPTTTSQEPTEPPSTVPQNEVSAEDSNTTEKPAPTTQEPESAPVETSATAEDSKTATTEPNASAEATQEPQQAVENNAAPAEEAPAATEEAAEKNSVDIEATKANGAETTEKTSEPQTSEKAD